MKFQKNSFSIILGIVLLLVACGPASAANQSNSNLVEEIDPSNTPIAIINDTPLPPIDSPIPPTNTPVPTVIPQVNAIIDGETGFLLGGSQNGNWLHADMVASTVGEGDKYQLFNTTEYIGEGIGTKAQSINEGPCTKNYSVELNPKPDFIPNLLVEGEWNVTPRFSTRIASNQVYKDSIEEILLEKQIIDPEVMITYILKVDLEGDGVDEVLIIAINFEDGKISPSVKSGNYSLIVLRKIVGGIVETIPLVFDVYLEDNDLAYPTFYLIDGIFDLNGDGRLDIVVEGKSWEGKEIAIFDIEQGIANQVLTVSCSE